MWIQHYWHELINTDWTDIGYDPLVSHAINVNDRLIEFAPLDIILAKQGTGVVIILLVLFYIFIVRNMIKGYREEPVVSAPAAPLSLKVDLTAEQCADRIRWIKSLK